MEKNYQIPLCKECGFAIKSTVHLFPECPGLIKCLDKQKRIGINYKKKSCLYFSIVKEVTEVTRVPDWCKRDTEKSNRRWFNSGKYYGQS